MRFRLDGADVRVIIVYVSIGAISYGAYQLNGGVGWIAGGALVLLYQCPLARWIK